MQWSAVNFPHFHISYMFDMEAEMGCNWDVGPKTQRHIMKHNYIKGTLNEAQQYIKHKGTSCTIK